MGFADNVFDQKRGGRRESGLNGPMTVANLAGKKRSIEPNGQGGPSTLRKLEFPTPEPDYARRPHMARDGSEFSSVPAYPTNTLPPILPGVKSVTDVDDMGSTISDDRNHRYTPSTPIFSTNGTSNTLAPFLSTSLYGSPYMDHRVPPIHDHSAPTSATRTTRTNINSFINTVTNTTSAPPRSPASHNHNHHVHDTTHHRFRSGPIQDPIQITTPTTESSPIATSSLLLEENIRKIEQQIQALQKYDEEFAALKLEESRRMLRGQISELEGQLAARRRERGLGLVERLRNEGFSSLAEQVGIEVDMAGQDFGMKVGLGIKESSSNGTV